MKIIKTNFTSRVIIDHPSYELAYGQFRERLLNKFILVVFCGAIRGKCEKCLNSWWNCLEMIQELKENGSQHDMPTYPISAYDYQYET